jgi:hypothetical protein
MWVAVRATCGLKEGLRFDLGIEVSAVAIWAERIVFQIGRC